MSVARRDGFIPADMRVVITPTGERITIHQQPRQTRGAFGQAVRKAMRNTCGRLASDSEILDMRR